MCQLRCELKNPREARVILLAAAAFFARNIDLRPPLGVRIRRTRERPSPRGHGVLCAGSFHQ